jgi:hypothetical protein
MDVMADANVADADMTHAHTHAATDTDTTTHAHRDVAAAYSSAAEASAAEAACIGRGGRTDEAGCAKRCHRSHGEHRGTELGKHDSLS